MSPNNRPAEPQSEQGLLLSVTREGGGYGNPATFNFELHDGGAYPEDIQKVDQPTEILAPSVDTRERAHLILQSLGHLAGVSMRRGLEKAVHTDERAKIEQSLAKKHNTLSGTLEGAKFNKNQEMKRAKATFLKAYNLGLETAVDENDIGFKDDFEAFTQKYGVGANPEQTRKKRIARDKFIKRLTKITAIPGTKVDEYYHVAENLSEIIDQEPTALSAPPSELSPRQFQFEVANTYDKLIGLRDDNRAGFLPTTNREKSQAFELLDYMDPTKYPDGVNQRLKEIFFRQQRVAAKEHGLKGAQIYDFAIDSVRSVINEWADYARNAGHSKVTLQALRQHLDSGLSPRISTAEATEPENGKTFDYNVLVRFATLAAFRVGEKYDFNPLLTREDRTINHPHKNKIVEDQYTAVGSLVTVQDYIDSVADKLSVRESRALLPVAIRDQEAREEFWLRALGSVTEGNFAAIAQTAQRSISEAIPA